MDNKEKSKTGNRLRLWGVKAGLCGLAVLCAAAMLGCSDNENKPGLNPSKMPVVGKDTPPVVSTNVRIPGDPEAGKVTYGKYCHYCHGTEGRGDGPVSIGIFPHPADFTTDAKRMSKTDQELFQSINDGIKKDIGGEAMFMPSWKDILTEQERWDALAYIRLLEKKGKEKNRRQSVRR